MWNGLNITKNFSISIEEADGIEDTRITAPGTPAPWYTVGGLRLNDKPTKPGVYVVDGQKVIIK